MSARLKQVPDTKLSKILNSGRPRKFQGMFTISAEKLRL